MKSSKEKKETIELLTNAKRYHEETEEAIGSAAEKDFTDYQFEVSLAWIRKYAGIDQEKKQ